MISSSNGRRRKPFDACETTRFIPAPLGGAVWLLRRTQRIRAKEDHAAAYGCVVPGALEGSNPDPKIEHPYNGAVNETGQQIGSDDLALAAGGIGGGGDRHHIVDADHIP